MQTAVYIITDRMGENMHIGYSYDLYKTTEAYKSDKGPYTADKRPAKLVWYQRFDSSMVAESKYLGLREMKPADRLELIQKHNPEMVDLSALANRIAIA